MLIDECIWKVWFIDYMCFFFEEDLFIDLELVKCCDCKVWECFKNVDELMIWVCFDGVFCVYEFDVLFKCWNILCKYIEDFIEECFELCVFFDVVVLVVFISG